MENHGIGTHQDKACAEISIGNTPDTQNLFGTGICPNWPTIWDIFEKSPLHLSMLFSIYNLARLKPEHGVELFQTTLQKCLF